MSAIHIIDIGYNCILRPMKREEANKVAAIADECVGKGLYSPQEMEEAADTDSKCIYVLETKDGEIVGYIYFFLTDRKSTAAEMKADERLLQTVCTDAAKPVGRIQSVAIRHAFRENGFSKKLVQFAFDALSAEGAGCVFTACWKKGDKVPLRATVQSCGFHFLAETENVWFDKEELFCPYCGGRCRCSAEIYYKRVDCL